MPQHHDTPMLDELEKGPWPSFISGLKRLATDDNPMMVDLLGQTAADDNVENWRAMVVVIDKGEMRQCYCRATK